MTKGTNMKHSVRIKLKVEIVCKTSWLTSVQLFLSVCIIQCIQMCIIHSFLVILHKSQVEKSFKEGGICRLPLYIPNNKKPHFLNILIKASTRQPLFFVVCLYLCHHLNRRNISRQSNNGFCLLSQMLASLT